jgi:predicted GNAT family acetyltransferase
MADVVIVDNRDFWRVEAHAGGKVAGFAAYRDKQGRRVFTHTEVDPEFEGQGIGSTLARAALDKARADGVGVVPLCPFIRRWIDEHPDYADLVVAD